MPSSRPQAATKCRPDHCWLWPRTFCRRHGRRSGSTARLPLSTLPMRSRSGIFGPLSPRPMGSRKTMRRVTCRPSCVKRSPDASRVSAPRGSTTSPPRSTTASSSGPFGSAGGFLIRERSSPPRSRPASSPTPTPVSAQTHLRTGGRHSSRPRPTLPSVAMSYRLHCRPGPTNRCSPLQRRPPIGSRRC